MGTSHPDSKFPGGWLAIDGFYEKVIKVKADVAALLNNLFSDVSLDVRW